MLRSVFLTVVACGWLASATAQGQEPLDLFANQVKLGNGFVRIGTWNLQHLQVKDEARPLLPGDTWDADYASLIATFAQAVDDLDLHVLVVVEHQPRSGEPDRLDQLCDRLNEIHSSAGSEQPTWQSRESHIGYDEPDDPYGNLQFGLLWQAAWVEVDLDAVELLEELRQPRGPEGQLLEKRHRVPWLVPLRAGQLQLDLLAVHLKSGGTTPQAAEVDALTSFIRRRKSADPPRHLVMLGDWNIRPDDASGRGRLKRLQVPTSHGNLMRILTVETLRPTLDQWAHLGTLDSSNPLSDLIPFTHFNDHRQSTTIDNMLDHLAISSTLDEVFDHPLRARLADGRSDLRPGIEIARPLLPKQDYLKLTDHLPVILTLRSDDAGLPATPEPPVPVRIVEAVPNPTGLDREDEEVTIRNFSRRAVSLAGWKIGDSTSSSFWELDAARFGDPAVLAAGARAVIRRQGRPMSLDNQQGDMIRLIDSSGEVVNVRTYDSATSGQRLSFD